MLFATDHDTPQMRALTYGLSIEIGVLMALGITSFSKGDTALDDVVPLLAHMLRWRELDAIDGFVKWRLAKYDRRRNAASPSYHWPRTVDFLDKFRAEASQRYQTILGRSFLPLVFSLVPECDRGDVTITANDTIALASEWYEWSTAPADLSAVQLFETVGMLIQPGSAHDILFIDGRLKRTITRGTERRITLDDGSERRCQDIGALIQSLR